MAEELQPHKVRYYPKRRDPEFKEKMRTVVTVYQEGFPVSGRNRKGFQGGNACRARPLKVITVAADEKPGGPSD